MCVSVFVCLFNQIGWVILKKSHLYFYWGLKLATNLKSGTHIMKFRHLLFDSSLVSTLENNQMEEIESERSQTLRW